MLVQSTHPLGLALDVSIFQPVGIILSQFTYKSKYAVINLEVNNIINDYVYVKNDPSISTQPKCSRSINIDSLPLSHYIICDQAK